ncbi:MAG: hypothetical protein IJW92_02525 [Clostridia bacterium]|nr:hypothetical protein [Clostridia bacterium]
MGFGCLLLGYLVTFVLYITVQALNVGSLALLAGFGLMFYGLSLLNRYHPAFAGARWLLVPLFAVAVYRGAEDISALFLVKMPWQDGELGAVLGSVMSWLTFFLLVFFQFAMLYGIRRLADSIELKKISETAIRNTLFVGIYAMLYVVCATPIPESVLPYLTLATNLVNLLCMIFNLLLLLNCNKSICREGDEEVAPKRSRFEWINRMGDTYDRTHRELRESARQSGEALKRRLDEKKNGKTDQKRRKK